MYGCLNGKTTEITQITHRLLKVNLDAVKQTNNWGFGCRDDPLD